MVSFLYSFIWLCFVLYWVLIIFVINCLILAIVIFHVPKFSAVFLKITFFIYTRRKALSPILTYLFILYVLAFFQSVFELVPLIDFISICFISICFIWLADWLTRDHSKLNGDGEGGGGGNCGKILCQAIQTWGVCWF